MDSSLRNRLLVGFLALSIVIGGGTLGYWIIGEGRWEAWDCLYMTVITVTTVGYGEVLSDMDVTPHARSFTMVLLVFGTGVLVYFASTITAFIVEGDLKDILWKARLKKRIKRMKDHIIVCGTGTTGRHIVEELIKTLQPVVAIDNNLEVLKEIADAHPKAEYSYLVGDATDDDTLNAAGLPVARGIVAALSGDKDNLYVVVSARQMNPQCRIIARCAELGHVEKIKRAGADGVVSPNFIGGMRMASEMMRPAVVKFLDEMLRDQRAMRIEEIAIAAGSSLDGKTLLDANVRERFGMSVLAVRGGGGGGGWSYNPELMTRLGAGVVLVVLGSAQQVKDLQAAAAA